jgi:hypothetical protein
VDTRTQPTLSCWRRLGRGLGLPVLLFSGGILLLVIVLVVIILLLLIVLLLVIVVVPIVVLFPLGVVLVLLQVLVLVESASTAINLHTHWLPVSSRISSCHQRHPSMYTHVLVLILVLKVVVFFVVAAHATIVVMYGI